ncbi:FlgD immunoglobulin-like domain containing protein, partial [Candidatus Latescibacterota bacterium]
YENTDHKSDYINYKTVWFTPDGTELTFSATKLDELGRDYIVSMDLDTEEIREITPGQFPVWSPSGRYLAYSMKTLYDNLITLMVYDAETETTTTLVEIPDENDNNITRPSFLPYESAVIFPLQSDGQERLYRIPLTGGTPEEIKVVDEGGNQYDCKYVDVHPDGKHMVVTGNIPGSKKILLWVDIDTGTSIPLTPQDENYSVKYATISPDGMRVCYIPWGGYGLPPPPWGGNPYELRILELDESMIYGYFQTSVEADTPTVFPTIASYPNPFNPTTTISFTLPDAGYTELAVFNLAGQKIRTLVAGELSLGVHEVVWDGCDDSGHPVSSGIFVSRLVTGDNVVTNRMTLVK